MSEQKNSKGLIVPTVILSIIIIAVTIAGFFVKIENLSPLVWGAIIISATIIQLIVVLTKAQTSPQPQEQITPVQDEIEKPDVEVAPVAAPPVKSSTSPEMAVMFLTLLQEKGRFVDFLMEDITSYSDEQVSGAARVVHQGCKEVLREAFNPQPIADQVENQSITLDKGFSAESYRIIGNKDTANGVSGTLIHKGWRAGHVKLPQPATKSENNENPVIIPAEVEV